MNSTPKNQHTSTQDQSGRGEQVGWTRRPRSRPPRGLHWACWCVGLLACSCRVFAQSQVDPQHAFAWCENSGWTNWSPAGNGVLITPSYVRGHIWGENTGWINVGNIPADGLHYANANSADYGVNVDAAGNLSGYAWGENVGWINFGGGAQASPPNPARIDAAAGRLRGFAWGENIGWINLDDATAFIALIGVCGSPDFNCDGDIGTDADIEAFFACLAGNCPPAPCTSSADFNADGDIGTDADIEAFFRVLAGGNC